MRIYLCWFAGGADDRRTAIFGGAGIGAGERVRAGDVIQAGIVYTGDLASFPIAAFAALNVVLTAAWLAVARGLNRRLQTQAGSGPSL